MQTSGRLPGMTDLLEEEVELLDRTQRALQVCLTRHGYRMVATPMLEATELFLRKSGGELASQMYSFVEPGGRRVSLRPEFTSAVIRLFIDRSDNMALPVRWSYAGPVFRHDARGAAGSPRQFTQVGAELIGAAGPYADAEVMALACQGLTGLGLKGLALVVGDVGMVQELLRQFDISERARVFILRSMGELRVGPSGREAVLEQAHRLGLLGEGAPGADLPGVPQQQTVRSDVHELARRVLANASSNPMGVRTPEEIQARLLWKLQATDAPDRVERALKFATELAAISGASTATLKAVRRLLGKYGLNAEALASLENLLASLASHCLDNVEVSLDMGLARGLAYYSGLVFEVRHGDSRDGAVLAGGGRYDGLVRALGGPQDVPALGFAYTLEQVVSAVPQREAKAGEPEPGPVLVASQNVDAYPNALTCAQEMRRRGDVVEVALRHGRADSHRAYARSRGMQRIVVVDEHGKTRQHRV